MYCPSGASFSSPMTKSPWEPVAFLAWLGSSDFFLSSISNSGTVNSELLVVGHSCCTTWGTDRMALLCLVELIWVTGEGCKSGTRCNMFDLALDVGWAWSPAALDCNAVHLAELVILVSFSSFPCSKLVINWEPTKVGGVCGTWKWNQPCSLAIVKAGAGSITGVTDTVACCVLS